MGQMPTLDEWRDLVDEHLGFLQDRGFRLEPVHDDKGLAAWGPRVQYLSSTTGLQVHWSVEFRCVDTYVIRLLEGRVPDYPIFIHDGDPINWFHFDYLRQAVAPKRKSRGGLDSDKVRRQLAHLAQVISDFPELLDPDSSAFESVTSRIHESVRKDPPQITVWMPEDASSEETERAVAESGSAFPRVGVVVRRYFRRRRRS